MTDRVLSLLSLANKAGAVKSGEYGVETAVKGGEAFLVIIARDASERSAKSYEDMCSYYEVPIRTYGTKESVGRAIGKEYRVSIAVCDEHFASGLLKIL